MGFVVSISLEITQVVERGGNVIRKAKLSSALKVIYFVMMITLKMINIICMKNTSSGNLIKLET